MFRVGVIGHFGLGLDLANGQTIKTKIVTNEVEQYCREKALVVDAHGGIKAIFPVVFGSIKLLKNCKNILLMLTENGLKVSVPILVLFNRLYYRKLHYVVIGGWLPEFLEKQPRLLKQLKRFNMIYVETNNMKKKLDELGLHNTLVMPNCKKIDILKKEELKINKKRPFKLCTFSRVMKEKGIEDAITATIEANKELEELFFELDIYGQVDSNQTEWFEKVQSKFPSYVKYRGIINYSDSTNVLKNYFALLFPTYYEGEGFAGTAIDAFSAGVPVIASDWKYNNEVIKNNVNGKLFETHNINQLTKILVDAAENYQNWNEMKEKCIQDANQYSPRNVMKILFNNLI